MLMIQFNEIKKKENESVKEFDTRFENLLKQIPDNIIPKDDVILIIYTNYFEGKFGFMLRDKAPKTLVEAQEQATKIEENLSVSKVEPFHAPHAKAKTKPRTLSNVEPTQDPMTLLNRNIKQLSIKIQQPVEDKVQSEVDIAEDIPPFGSFLGFGIM
jgi:hypothetical protein